MTAAEEVIRVPKAAELVASTLRRQIVSGELKQDDALPSEALIMQQFQVSRPTLREAFRILESESLIHVRRGARGGARVQVPDGDVAARYVGYVLEYRGTAMADVYHARAELEVPLARLLAENAKPKQVARLKAAIAAAAECLDDPEAYAQHDTAFHLLVAELAGNETLEVLLQMVYHIVGTARRRYTAIIDRSAHQLEHEQVHKTHAKLVEAIASRDPDAAEALWRKHMVEVNKHYLSRPLAKTVVEMMQ